MKTVTTDPATTAVIYARTSHDDPQDDRKKSAEQQTKICRDLATKHGLTVIAAYEDRDISGAIWADVDFAKYDYVTAKKYNGQRRPGFTQALGHLLRGQAKTIIVWNTTRVARPISDTFTGWLTDLFKSNEVRILSQEKGWTDYNVFADDISTSIETKILRREINANTGRAIEAKEALAAEGYLTSGACYGYKSVGKGTAKLPNGRLPSGVEIVPEQAEAVKLMYQWYAVEGQGFWVICRRLTELGKTTQRGKLWQLPTVNKILHNPSYIGKYEAEDGTLHDSPIYKPIVSEEVWYQAQSISRTVNGISKRSKAHNSAYWLSGGLLLCGKCGVKMRAKTSHDHKGKTVPYYCCPSPGCTDRVSVRVDEMHKLVQLLIEKRNHGLLASGLEDSALAKLGKTEVYQKLEALKKRLSDVEQRKSELALDVEKLMDKKVFNVALATLTTEATRLTEEIALIESMGKSQYPVNAGLREQANWLFKSITVYRRKACYIQYHTGHGLPIPAKTGRGRQYWFYPFAPEEHIWQWLQPPDKCEGLYANPTVVPLDPSIFPQPELTTDEEAQYYPYTEELPPPEGE